MLTGKIVMQSFPNLPCLFGIKTFELVKCHSSLIISICLEILGFL